MIGTANLGKSYGGRTLFEGVSLKLNPGSRYGLVGANGSGKTTFLKILAGDEPATEGNVMLPKEARCGVLRQDRFLRDEDAILDLTMAGDPLVYAALMEQRAIVEHGTGDAARLGDLEDVLRHHDGYTLEARATAILEGLGIPGKVHRQPLATLSGGFKLRVLLAQVLIGGPDVLLLDEPTNHLDILSIRWLEKFLAAYKGCAIVISHDQRFLDNVATHVLDVDYGTITVYTGNYAAFVIEKEETRLRKQAELTRIEEEIAHKQAYVDRFRYKASKATQAQSRLKQIEKIEIPDVPETSRRAPQLKFVAERPSGRDVLSLEGIAKSYGDKVVLRDVSLLVRRGERVAVIGPNGLGKSTLLRIAVGALAADRGTATWGHEARVGYFAQDHREQLDDPNTTPLDVIWGTCPKETTSFVRGALGRVLLSGDAVDKKVGSLSGGEAARLIFCKLMVQRPNVLVFDEPTNHLDLESIQALVTSLKTYDGTVLFVSHDRWFVSELATRILEVTPDGPRDFPGTYEDYLARCGDDHLDADTVVLKAKKERKKEGAASSSPVSAGSATDDSWEEQKRKRNRRKELPARRDKVMADLDAAESRKKVIHDLYGSAGFFEQKTREELAAIEKEDAGLDATIAALMAEWEKLEAEIAELGAG